MPVASKGFLGVSIPEELAKRVDSFVRHNDWAYRSRSEVVVAALREFLLRHGKEPQPVGSDDSESEVGENQGVKRNH